MQSSLLCLPGFSLCNLFSWKLATIALTFYIHLLSSLKRFGFVRVFVCFVFSFIFVLFLLGFFWGGTCLVLLRFWGFFCFLVWSGWIFFFSFYDRR